MFELTRKSQHQNLPVLIYMFVACIYPRLNFKTHIKFSVAEYLQY